MLLRGEAILSLLILSCIASLCSALGHCNSIFLVPHLQTCFPTNPCHGRPPIVRKLSIKHLLGIHQQPLHLAGWSFTIQVPSTVASPFISLEANSCKTDQMTSSFREVFTPQRWRFSVIQFALLYSLCCLPCTIPCSSSEFLKHMFVIEITSVLCDHLYTRFSPCSSVSSLTPGPVSRESLQTCTVDYS